MYMYINVYSILYYVPKVYVLIYMYSLSMIRYNSKVVLYRDQPIKNENLITPYLNHLLPG